MPTGTVNEEYLALYASHFGDHFYAFDTDELHMVVLNAPIINSNLDAEETQKKWLDKNLAENAHIVVAGNQVQRRLQIGHQGFEVSGGIRVGR